MTDEQKPVADAPARTYVGQPISIDFTGKYPNFHMPFQLSEWMQNLPFEESNV